jgi:sialate O-acetylesterase
MRNSSLVVHTGSTSRFTSWFTVIALTAALWSAQAELKVNSLISDNMVLQRDASVPVWGWADEGQVVIVTFRGQTARAGVKDGKWMARLSGLKPGAPGELMVATKTETLRFTNVVVGEVWVCSGQSNMQWPLQNTWEPEAVIAAATNCQIRLFSAPMTKSDVPRTNTAAAWKNLSPGAVKKFSAVAYYFGRALQAQQGVPVGLIQTAWGGSPAEVWMSAEVLAANPRFKKEIVDAYPAARAKYEADLAMFKKARAEAREQGRKFNQNPPHLPWKPSELYNGMIAPLLPYAIKGAIWYQGESNAGRAEQYRPLFPDMIRNWRRDWGQADFPFLCVQLAPFMEIKSDPGESDWAELREAQWLATKALPKVGMAVITDVGNPTNIHPTLKLPVGERLALAARSIAYGEHVTFSGPQYRSLKIKGGQAELSFDSVGKGLEARGGELTGFAICGEDLKWVWASAAIKGKKVVVSSPQVPKPVAVRYGWADCPVVNLWNKDGLPATPFRTDDFPMITAPKK